MFSRPEVFLIANFGMYVADFGIYISNFGI